MSNINTNQVGKYKYGTTMLVKEETKNRITSRFSFKSESYDTILKGILDKADRYEELEKMPEFQKFLVKINKLNWLDKEKHSSK